MNRQIDSAIAILVLSYLATGCSNTVFPVQDNGSGGGGSAGDSNSGTAGTGTGTGTGGSAGDTGMTTGGSGDLGGTGGAVGSGGAAGSLDAGMSGSNDAALADATDGAVVCHTPSILYPPKNGITSTIFCPFSAADGGKDIYCNKGTEHCCEPDVGVTTLPSSCDPLAVACRARSTDWACGDPTDCPMGQVCCGTGAVVINPDPTCANYATSFHGAHCAATCMMGTEFPMCTSDAECGVNRTCVPFTVVGSQVGACR